MNNNRALLCLEKIGFQLDSKIILDNVTFSLQPSEFKLLDEITSALDEDNKIKVNELIHHYVKEQKIAALWVTHDQNEIKHADDVIHLPSHMNN